MAVENLGETDARQTLAPAVGAPPGNVARPRGEGGDDIALEIKDLTIDFASVDGRVRILNGVSLVAKKGEVVGIVG